MLGIKSLASNRSTSVAVKIMGEPQPIESLAFYCHKLSCTWLVTREMLFAQIGQESLKSYRSTRRLLGANGLQFVAGFLGYRP